MWKSDLSGVNNRIVFHNGCGKGCGNLCPCVEKETVEKVFHISTAPTTTTRYKYKVFN